MNLRHGSIIVPLRDGIGRSAHPTPRTAVPEDWQAGLVWMCVRVAEPAFDPKRTVIHRGSATPRLQGRQPPGKRDG